MRGRGVKSPDPVRWTTPDLRVRSSIPKQARERVPDLFLFDRPRGNPGRLGRAGSFKRADIYKMHTYRDAIPDAVAHSLKRSEWVPVRTKCNSSPLT